MSFKLQVELVSNLKQKRCQQQTDKAERANVREGFPLNHDLNPSNL